MKNTAIEQMICEFIADYPRRREVATRWRSPIVGFAAAGDPLFSRFKRIIRPSHITPHELLAQAKTVVAYFVPFSRELHRENGKTEHYCSRSWAVAYVETNRLIAETNAHVKRQLRVAGYEVALIPPIGNFDQKRLTSDWSHRHVAYAAGIGRFGVHNLLITEHGCTGRIGSLVTDLPLDPSALPEGEFCLQKAGTACLKCVDRCEFHALQTDGYDRHACYRQCLVNDRHHEDLELTDVCGKCSAMVPCSVTNPVSERAERRVHEFQ